MHTFQVNISGVARREQWQGRDYLVAPLSMIVPGVLSGSKGPIYYPLEELARNVSDWNGIPIVIDHPYRNGTPVSARDPGVMEAQGVGHVYHAHVNGKLAAEGWFDVDRVRNLDERILTALEEGNPLELSTGLGLDEDGEGGVHNGNKYRATARNLRPDHLAVFADKTGACSIKDGCGVHVNEETEEQKVSLLNRLAEWLGIGNATKTMGGKSLSASAFAYVPDVNKPSTWKLRIDDATHVGGAIAAIGKGFRGQKVQIPAADMPGVKRKIKSAWLKFHPDKGPDDVPDVLNETVFVHDLPVEDPVTNIGEMSLDDISSALRGKLYDKLDIADDEDVYVIDVYQTYFVYRREGRMYMLPYGMMGNTVMIGEDDPVEVKRLTLYKPVENEGSDKGGSSEDATSLQQEPVHDTEVTDNREEESAMADNMNVNERKVLVDSLIANCECAFDESDREYLNKMPDAKLQKLHGKAEEMKNYTAVANAAKRGAAELTGNEHNTEPGQRVYKDGELLDSIDPKWLQPGDTFERVWVGNEVKYKIARGGKRTAEQWLADAPEEVRQVHQQGVAALNKERQDLINHLLVNVDGSEIGAKMEDLKKKTLDELRFMVSLVPKPRTPAPSYYYGNTPAVNAPGDLSDEDDVMPDFTLEDILQEEKASRR